MRFKRRRFINGSNKHLVPETVTRVFEITDNHAEGYTTTVVPATTRNYYLDDLVKMNGSTLIPWGAELYLSGLAGTGMYQFYKILKVQWSMTWERHSTVSTHNSLIAAVLDEDHSSIMAGLTVNDQIENPYIYTKMLGSAGNNTKPRIYMSGKCNVQKYKRMRAQQNTLEQDSNGGWVESGTDPAGPRPILAFYNTAMPNYGAAASSGRSSFKAKVLVSFTRPNYNPS